MGTIKAVDLSSGDLGKRVAFKTSDFGAVSGELYEFGVPDGHPSLWSNPVTSMEIKVKSASGAHFSFEVPADTPVVVGTV